MPETGGTRQGDANEAPGQAANSQQKLRVGPRGYDKAYTKSANRTRSAPGATEPIRPPKGRTHMRSMTLLITAAVLAVAGCGNDSPDSASPADGSGVGGDGGGDNGGGGNQTEGLAGQPIHAQLVLLADSASGIVAPPTVLDGPTAVQAYPGWFSDEPAVYNKVLNALAGQGGYPTGSQPLLAFTNGPSCASVDDAKLMVDGTQVYAAFNGTKAEECLAAHTQVAIFQVSRTALPKDFTLVGTDSAGADASAGPGEPLVFQQLTTTPDYQPPPPREVTDDQSLDQFAAALPSDQAEVRDAAASLGADQRAFGFVLTGCAARGAELIVTPSKVSAATVGGENVRCIAPMYYVAVFAVDAEQLPDQVALG